MGSEVRNRHRIKVKVFGQEKSGSMVIQKVAPDRFNIVDNSMFNKNTPGLGFMAWDKDLVLNMDKDSDEWQCFKISTKLSIEGCVADGEGFTARGMKGIKEIIKHITYIAYDPGDI